MSHPTTSRPGGLPVCLTADGSGGVAAEALTRAHAHILSLSPTATAELILALTVDVRRLNEADAVRVRLAAIRLARELYEAQR